MTETTDLAGTVTTPATPSAPPGADATDAVEGSEAVDASVRALPFDDALAELQRTVAELEAGGQPLEEAIRLYERGVALQRHCDRLLNEAELRVRQLVARAGGALEARDVTPDEVSEEA